MKNKPKFDNYAAEDWMTAEEFDAWMKSGREAVKKKQKKYSLEEVEIILNNYQNFAAEHASAFYERNIELSSSKIWLNLNK